MGTTFDLSVRVVTVAVMAESGIQLGRCVGTIDLDVLARPFVVKVEVKFPAMVGGKLCDSRLHLQLFAVWEMRATACF